MNTGHTKTAPGPGRVRQIEGRHNPLLKELRSAFAHAELTPDGCVAIEGLRIIEEAIRSSLRFRTLFFSHSAQVLENRLLPQMGTQVETVSVPDKLFSGAVPTESPQGVAALVRWNAHSQDALLSRADSRPVLILAGLQDPGNLGTIIRSAEAFDAAGVVLGEGTVSPFNPKVIRASAGSVFRLPVIRATLKDFLHTLHSQQFRIAATSSHRGVTLNEVDLTHKIAVLIGNEGAGIPRELAHAVNQTIAIPHSFKVESLNAGIAASIVLYEASRQRNSASNRAKPRSHETPE